MICAASSPRNSAATRSAPSIPAVYASRANQIPVHDPSLIHGNGAEVPQQMKHAPVRCRSTSLEQTSRAANESTCANRKYAPRARRLALYPIQQFVIFHPGFLSEAAGHMQEIELGRF